MNACSVIIVTGQCVKNIVNVNIVLHLHKLELQQFAYICENFVTTQTALLWQTHLCFNFSVIKPGCLYSAIIL